MVVREPTKEQKRILSDTGNIVVTAKPGSGKTFTVVEKIASVLPDLLDFQGVIAISFTNKASSELRSRCKARGVDPKQSFWGTIDKFYISQIIIPFASHITGKLPKYEVVSDFDSDSVYNQLNNISYPFSNSDEDLIIRALGDGFIPLNLTGEMALFLLNNVSGVLKYLTTRYKYIFIDEYQDCGNIQHAIFTLLVDNGIIGIAVGDINQAIYGFTKRFPEYLISLIGSEKFSHYELTKNHRCHESISEYSLCLFNASKKIPDEKRMFAVYVHGHEQEIAKQIEKKIEQIKNKYGISNSNEIAVLCRSNSTVERISSFFSVPQKVFKDTLLDRDSSEWGRLFRELLIATFDDSIYAVDFTEQFFSQEYETELYNKMLNLCHMVFSCNIMNINKQEDIFIQLAQLIYPGKRNEQAINHLHTILVNEDLLSGFLPANKNEINIMTIHKSKGLEFDAVFHLDLYQYILPNECGDERMRLQDLNLHYVGITRAKKVCYLMIGDKRYNAKKKIFFDAYSSPFLSMRGLRERRCDVEWKS